MIAGAHRRDPLARSRTSASRRSRSSCSTAATACTARSSDQSAFLMIPPDERYDLAHFEFVMRGIQEAREKLPRAGRPDLAVAALRDRRDHDRLHASWSRQEGTLTGLRGLQRLPAAALGGPGGHDRVVPRRTRPGCPNINLLHLSSRKAVDGGDADGRRRSRTSTSAARSPSATCSPTSTPPHGLGGKVNPPLRPREDVEALWEHLLAGDIDWVVSDHACCKDETEVRRAPRRRLRWPSPASAAPSTCCPAWSARDASAGCRYRRIAELTSLEPGPALRAARARATIGVGLRRRLLPRRPVGDLDGARRGLASRRRSTRRSRASS